MGAGEEGSMVERLELGEGGHAVEAWKVGEGQGVVDGGGAWVVVKVRMIIAGATPAET